MDVEYSRLARDLQLPQGMTTAPKANVIENAAAQYKSPNAGKDHAKEVSWCGGTATEGGGRKVLTILLCRLKMGVQAAPGQHPRPFQTKTTTRTRDCVSKVNAGHGYQRTAIFDGWMDILMKDEGVYIRAILLFKL